MSADRVNTKSQFSFEIFADYFQFYLQDEAAEGNLGDAWTEEAVSRLLALAPGTIGIGTVRNMDVSVSVELLPNAPSADLDKWDVVNECSIEVPTGRIVIAGCTDFFPDAARIPLQPGTYRARISYGALDKVSDDQLAGEDHYRVQLWIAPFTNLVVLKRREP